MGGDIGVAYMWGTVSAVSLPLGACLAMSFKFFQGHTVTAVMMAFGGGALLFASAVFLFGTAVHHAARDGVAGVLVMAAAAVCGGLFFELLSSLLQRRGAAYMRFATLKRSLDHWRKREMVMMLTSVPLFDATPEEELLGLCKHMHKEYFAEGDIIFLGMNAQTNMYMLVNGDVGIHSVGGKNLEPNYGKRLSFSSNFLRRRSDVHAAAEESYRSKDPQRVVHVRPGEIFGHYALLTGENVECTAVCMEETTVLVLPRQHLNRWIANTQTFTDSLENLQRMLHDLRSTEGAIESSVLTKVLPQVKTIKMYQDDVLFSHVVGDTPFYYVTKGSVMVTDQGGNFGGPRGHLPLGPPPPAAEPTALDIPRLPLPAARSNALSDPRAACTDVLQVEDADAEPQPSNSPRDRWICGPQNDDDHVVVVPRLRRPRRTVLAEAVQTVVSDGTTVPNISRRMLIGVGVWPVRAVVHSAEAHLVMLPAELMHVGAHAGTPGTSPGLVPAVGPAASPSPQGDDAGLGESLSLPNGLHRIESLQRVQRQRSAGVGGCGQLSLPAPSYPPGVSAECPANGGPPGAVTAAPAKAPAGQQPGPLFPPAVAGDLGDGASPEALAESVVMTPDRPKKSKEDQASSAMSVWLGLLIDACPESLVIGMMTNSDKGVSAGFIAGVFLANLPEAISATVGMRASGMRALNVLALWGSITLITGIGAAVGAAIFSDPENAAKGTKLAIHGIEGIAGGAMLSSILGVMMPEAFSEGGHIVGMSALTGFLMAMIVEAVQEGT